MTTLKVPVTLEDHSQGTRSADITLVEYGDYECPHCGRAYPIIRRVQKHFEERLMFVFRNFPLGEMHPHAEVAAETAELAAAQGKFWEMHDSLFEHQEDLSNQMLFGLVEEIGIRAEALRRALASGEFGARVRNDFIGGVRSGVNGTPTFFINGRRHDGPFDFEHLVKAIEDRQHS